MKRQLTYLAFVLGFFSFGQFSAREHHADRSTAVCKQHGNQYLITHPTPASEVDKFQLSTQRSVTSYTVHLESIHSVWMEFQLDTPPASSLSYAIGTDPSSNMGMGNLIYWQSLRLGSRKTLSYSLPEIQQSGQPASATFDEGVDFYISLSVDGVVETFGPYQIYWEDLGNPANQLQVNFATDWSLDYDGASVINSNGFTAGEVSIVQDFCDKMIPIMKEIYGPPSHDYEVTFVKNANLTSTNVFFGGPNEIHVGSGAYELDHRLLTHEMIHAFHDNVACSSNDIWHYDPKLSGFEEGFAEGVAFECMTRFNELYPGYLPIEDRVRWNGEGSMEFEWDYDFQNHRQITTEDYWSSDQGTGSHWLRYGMGAAAMRKIKVENSGAFRLFNLEYYARMNADHALLPTRTLMVECFSSFLNEIERTPVAEWFDQQRIYDCSIDARKKVFMLSFHGLSWMNFDIDNRIFMVETGVQGYEWSWDINDGAGNLLERWYHQTNNIPGTFSIYNSANNLVVSQDIINDAHWLIEPGGPYFGESLLGPYQGGNPANFGGQFTANEAQNDCNILPDCGKMPYAMGNHSIYTSTASPSVSTTQSVENSTVWFENNNITAPNVLYDLRETQLYRYEVEFNDPQGPPVTERYYRLNGDGFINPDGIIGGIHYEDNTVIAEGRLYVEHEDFGPEPEIAIDQQAFIAQRSWASVPETDPNWYGDRSDRKYAVPGEIHAIYLDSDCSNKKIDFRNINYGDGLSGVQMLKFNVDEMEDILFEANVSSPVCEGEEITFESSNNFPDIFSGDDRISYNWVSPSGSSISTDTTFVMSNVTVSDTGVYNLEITFFNCPVFSLPVQVDINELGSLSMDEIPDTTLCENESVNIIPDQISDATYSWIGPNGFSSTQSELNIDNLTDQEEGVYTLIVSKAGCNDEAISDTLTFNISVQPDPSVNLQSIPDNTICESDTISIAVLTESGVNYVWEGPNNFTSTDTLLQLNNLTVSDQGTYYLIGYSDGCSGLVADTTSFEVTIQSDNSIPLTPLNDLSVCEGQDTVLAADSIPGLTYSWTGPNGFTSNEVQPNLDNVSSAFEGIYTLVVSHTGCSGELLNDTTEMTLTVEPSIVIETPTISDYEICLGDPIQINADSLGNPDITYNWLLPDGATISNQAELNISNTDASNIGAYTLILEALNCNDQTISEETAFTISAAIAPDNSINYSGETSICFNESLSLSVDSLNDHQYAWLNLAGDTLSGTTLFYNVASSDLEGVYTIISQVEFCNEMLENSVAVDVEILDFSDEELIVSQPAPVCEGDSLSLSSNSIAYGDYNWTDPSGNSVGDTSYLELFNVMVSSSGIYTLSVDFPCPDQRLEQTVEVSLLDDEICDSENHIYIPNGFSPNGDLVNDEFIVSGKGIQSYQIQIYNRWGQLVFSSEEITHSWNGTFNGEDLNSAVFSYQCFVQFTDGSREILNGNISLIR